MPCCKCHSDFNLFNWKIKCGECSDKYCTKCLQKNDGILYCEKCSVLLARPPDPAKLMNLKAKELQDYLRKHNISTHGLVEKQELVELLCRRHIPIKPKRVAERLTANFAGSVPNLKPPDVLTNFLSGVLPNTTADEPISTSQNGGAAVEVPPPPTPPTPSPPPPPPTLSSSPPPTSPTRASSEPQPTTSADCMPPPPKYPKISEFHSAAELAELSPKELMILLTLNRVNYKGCVEKSELLERATRLWRDNSEREGKLPENVAELCKLCMDAPLDCVLLECGHIATCVECGKRLAECPICRQYVTRVVKTFKA